MDTVGTEIVYVVNAGYLPLLRISLGSLLQSGSHFDSVRIFLVGCPPPEWPVADRRVNFVEVEDLFPDDFLRNKIHMMRSEAERLVFLDADTLILGRLDDVYSDASHDFLGRIANPYLRRDWNREGWEKACRRLGARPVPYFNSGFVVFQNGSHRSVAGRWQETMQGGAEGTLFEPGTLHVNPRYRSGRYLEQLSLSLAVAAAGLSWRNMAPHHHAWAWNNEPHAGAVVYHTAAPKFLGRAAEICAQHGLEEVFAESPGRER